MPRRANSETRLERGQALGRYELVSRLGRGGFAEVWLAKLSGKGGFEKQVAIKVIRQDHIYDPHLETMFLDEARLTASLDHPNVARVFELGDENGAPYLVMEYVRGASLHDLRRLVTRAGAAFPPAIMVRILADVCAGLHAAHELVNDEGLLLGVVHRDVSPNNVLVSDHGATKLIDFGVAKARNRLGGDTATGVTKGKILYMSPEQAKGMPVDRRADIWAIGAIAYELLEGRPAFDAPNDVARLHAVIGSKPLAPFTREVPPPLDDVVRRALSRRPTERQATANELRRELEEALDRSRLRATYDDVAAFVAEHAPSEEAEEERPSLRKMVGKIRAPSEVDETGTGEVVRGHEGKTDVQLAPPHEPPLETSSSFVGAPSRFLQRSRAWPAVLALVAVLGSVFLVVGLVKPRSTTQVVTASAASAVPASPPTIGDAPPLPAAIATEAPAVVSARGMQTRPTTPLRRTVSRPSTRKPSASAHVSYEDTIQ